MEGSPSRKRSSVLKAATSLLNLATIPLALTSVIQATAVFTQELNIELEAEARQEVQAFLEYFNPRQGAILVTLLFLVLAALMGIRARQAYLKGREKSYLVVTLIQAVLFLAGAAVPMLKGFDIFSLLLVSLLYVIAMVAGRIQAMIRDHRVRSVIANVLCILVLLASITTYIITGMLIFFVAVLSLMKIIFGPINLPVLRRIIRKTYAAEIMFGLLLLVVTFSLLLVYFEPGMSNFKDALWYCFAIVTTIGFGDLTAVTDFGRVLSVILGIYGIIVVALITSIIVNFYGEMKKDGNVPGEDKPNEQEETAEENP